jgi:hypothetical protein
MTARVNPQSRHNTIVPSGWNKRSLRKHETFALNTERLSPGAKTSEEDKTMASMFFIRFDDLVRWI